MHEQSITFQLQDGPYKGKWVNTHGVYNGQPINEDVAHGLLMQGKIPLLGGQVHNTLGEADLAAQIRSLLFSEHENSEFDKLQPLYQDLVQPPKRRY